MRLIKNIVIHCSAGYGNIDSMRRFWRDVLKWRSPGYHVVIDLEGNATQIQPYSLPSNGVKGYNSHSIHISYIGGVERNNVNKAVDSRTSFQKETIIKEIQRAQNWIRAQNQDVSKVNILGHRDFSPDQNGDGVISSWERIKECPSFDAIPEYKHLIPSEESVPGYCPKESIYYVVRSGDSLSKIAMLFGTTVKNIKTLNNLKSDLIRIDQELKIK